MRSTLPLAAAAVVAACGGLVNPYFDGESISGGSSSSSSSTATSPSTTSTTTTTTTTASASADASSTTGGLSDSGDTSSSTTTTSSSTTDESTSTTDESTSTGAPATSAFCPDLNPPADALLVGYQCQIVGDGEVIACLAPIPWAAAEGVCKGLCGRLVIAPDDAARVALFAALQGALSDAEKRMDSVEDQPSLPSASAWVGACRAASVFTWTDGTPMPATPGMDGWGPQDPDGGANDCVVQVLYGKSAANGYWHDRDPGLAYRFACERE